MKLTTSKLKQMIKEELGREKDFQKLGSMGLEQDEISLVMSALEGDERAQNEFYDSQALEKLTDYYQVEMPYGVKTGREGVPDVWILNKLKEEGLGVGEEFNLESAIAGLGDISNEVRDELLNFNPKTQQEFVEIIQQYWPSPEMSDTFDPDARWDDH